MICGKHSRMRSPSPPNDALYLSTTFAGAAFWTTVNGACAADEIRPSSMTTTSEKRSYASWQLVDSCWHSRLQEGKRKVLLASIENSENWRDGMPARVGYTGHLEGQNRCKGSNLSSGSFAGGSMLVGMGRSLAGAVWRKFVLRFFGRSELQIPQRLCWGKIRLFGAGKRQHRMFEPGVAHVRARKVGA